MIHLLRPRFILLTLLVLTSALLAQDISPADTSSAPIDPFSGSAADPDIDYDALVRELYGSSEEEVAEDTTATVLEEVKQPRKRKQRAKTSHNLLSSSSLFHGANLALNVASPYATTKTMQSWYSYIDYGVTLRLPYEAIVENFPLYFDVEVSTFSFENTFPEGGSFEGLSYSIRANAQFTRSGLHFGLGFWESALGGLLQYEYIFWPGNSLFLKLGSRAVLLTDVEPPDADPLGAVWWLDLRLSTGFQF